MSQPDRQSNSEKRALGGVLHIDKPAGITSHDVVATLRRLSGIRRIGHAGTLDPLATGALLVCIGRATRLSEYLIGQDKRYRTTIRLGQETNTYDAEGEITAEKPVAVDEPAIQAALNHFRGPIAQLPPMFSAIKKDGQPLYKLARQGVEIERPTREVTIYELTLISWTSPDLELDILCSSGTYIRSIAHDLGQLLGCGGHITALRRTAIGQFSIDTAVPLASLTAENWLEKLQPADVAAAHLPAVEFSNEEAARLQQGQRIAWANETGPASSDQLVRAYDEEGLFIGIVAAGAGYWQPRKILVLSDS
jgi:tRNA pseudouridine55 synthase